MLAPMAREFKLPDLGEGVAEGEIVKWLVHEGDTIKEDQPMVEVMTDKATVQIPSPVTGRVGEIKAKEGQTVKVGSTLLVFDEDGKIQQGKGEDAAAASKPGIQQSQSQQATARSEGAQKEVLQPQPQSAGRPVAASPATRRLARELGVNIESVPGSGPGGRITDEDVRKFAASGGVAAPAPTQLISQAEHLQGEVPTESRPMETRTAGQLQATAPQTTAPEKLEERLPIHGIRRLIAEKMTKSVRTAAHVTHVDEVDFTQLQALKEKAKSLAEEKGIKLTLMPFIMKSIVATLKEFPYFNASIDDEKQEIVVKHYYNIGFATDTRNGLIVPVVKDVDKKSIIEIARELADLSAKARDGKIGLEEVRGGTFTITNIGTLGGIISTPIINVPEVAILGIHKIQKRPVVRDDRIVIREVAFVSVSFDHRIVDGADAARFTTRLISFLENPGLLLFPESSAG